MSPRHATNVTIGSGMPALWTGSTPDSLARFTLPAHDRKPLIPTRYGPLSKPHTEGLALIRYKAQ
jgi:hypothetical protein